MDNGYLLIIFYIRIIAVEETQAPLQWQVLVLQVVLAVGPRTTSSTLFSLKEPDFFHSLQNNHALERPWALPSTEA